MHDPLHVVFSIRRPSAKGRAARTARDLPSFAFWTLSAATYTDPEGVQHHPSLRRRIYWHPAFFRLGDWEWFLPALITVWHRDPETDGSDSSCRHAVRARRQQAIKEHRFLAAAFWDWWWRRYDLFHVHHWRVQFDLAQRWRRRLLTRCATCGGREKRGRPVNFHVVVDRQAETRRWGSDRFSLRERWLTGEANLHHHDCADLASIRATKANLPGWLAQWGHDEWCMNHQREQEPYYGCYPWWREAILGEDPETAALLASLHVQRSVHPCRDCGGSGQRVIGTVSVSVGADGGAQRNPLMGVIDRRACETCDGTGHPRVEKPIPAELV